jgi:predicted dehydrogenase
MEQSFSRRSFLQSSGALAAASVIPNFNLGQPERKVGWAILGLGSYATRQIMPSFKDCEKSKLVAVISGSPDKARRLAEQYSLPESAVYSYDNMDRIKDNPEIDVVYVITPPGTHRDFSVRAAQAGKHVCCEKPMANTVQECQDIIDACNKASTKLQIGYRSHYEPHNIRAIEACRGQLGQLRTITSEHGFNIPNGLWRTQKALSGGGSMMDIGIYSVQAARYLAGEDPTEVFAMIHNPPNDPRFAEVEDTVNFTLRFPGGALANCASGYSWSGMNRYQVIGTRGRLAAEPATGYSGHRLWINNQQQEIQPNNQFAAQMDHLSECILDNKPVLTDGEMGLIDIKIIMAIYESAATGRPVKL